MLAQAIALVVMWLALQRAVAKVATVQCYNGGWEKAAILSLQTPPSTPVSQDRMHQSIW